MSMRFIIVDNQRPVVVNLQELLVRLGHDRSHIWPEELEVFKNWETVFDRLLTIQQKGFDPKTSCCILLLDLALDLHSEAYHEGIAAIRRYAHTTLSPYVILIHTKWPTAAPTLEPIIDGIIDKHSFEADDITVAARALRSAIIAGVKSWSKRTGRNAPDLSPLRWRLTDSPAARRAEAALGTSLPELVERVADGWTDVQATVLTGGYSGAFVIKIDGRDGDSPVNAICKVSRERELLEQEVTAFKRASRQYHMLAGLLVPMETQIQPLGSKARAWFIVQCAVPGETLEHRLLPPSEGSFPTTDQLEADFAPAIARLRGMAEAGIAAGIMLKEPTNLYFADSDVERFVSSADSLVSVRDQCVQRDFLRDEPWHAPSAVRRFQREVVAGWRDRLHIAGFSTVLMHDQHGDLNPRNIILDADRHTHLIDFARFGQWPIAYDLVRLELQLFLRLIDTPGMGDTFGDRIKLWTKIWHNICEPTGPVVPCAAADAQVLEGCLWIADKMRMARDVVFRQAAASGSLCNSSQVVNLLRTFDGIKMSSYQDATWFKRLWFLLIAMDSAAKCGLFHIAQP